MSMLKENAYSFGVLLSTVTEVDFLDNGEIIIEST